MLVEHAGHLVSKDDLLERVWPKVIDGQRVAGADLRPAQILGPEAIATVAGQGYRFTLEAKLDPVLAPVAGAPKHNLPQQLTSFIARERECTELQQFLSTSRLVTLTGTGGCGKTRLALKVAGDVLDRYPDGVWLVELAALADPKLVPQSVGEALGVVDQTGRTLLHGIVGHVRDKRALIVLDNAEHVLLACAEVAEALVRASAHVTVLVTSREQLGIGGERTFRVPSLSVPDAAALAPGVVSASEAARLVSQRARLQRPDFAVTVANAPALAAVCRQLDGIPLAIELAASRARSMSMEEIAQRLARLFSLLTGGSPTHCRQRTLRSLIDWSYDLLDEHEQALMRRLAVFAVGGRWTGRKKHAAARASNATKSSTCSHRCATSPLVIADEIAGRRAIACWRRFASTRRNG